jgi:cell wall-associated NlpC family hydrolase
MWWGDYIGRPFSQANCWQLVRAVFAEQRGIDLPEYGEISAADLMAVARGMRAEAVTPRWREVSRPEPFDVVTMRKHKLIIHVGVITRAGWVLHTEEATGAVHVRLDHQSVAGRIVNFQRYLACP